MASPEAQTRCTDTWNAAKLAREELLEQTGPRARLKAARAVFAQAECERQLFDARDIQASDSEAMLVAMRSARTQYQNAQNLYREVVAYQVARLVHAEARLGDLHLAFAQKLHRAKPPGDVSSPGERADYRAELADLARQFEREATLSYASALDKATVLQGLVPEDPGAPAASDAEGWIADACARLAQLEPRMRQPLCSRQP